VVNRSPTKPGAEDEKWRAEQRRLGERQLRVAKWLNWITIVAAIVAGAGIYVLYATLGVTQLAANAAKTQADTAQQELEISHRPWVASVRPAEVTAPFVFAKTGGATVEITVPIKNTGTSTAINVFPLPRVIIVGTKEAHDQLTNTVRSYNCQSPQTLDSIASVISGTPIPPGAEISYRVPEGASSFPQKLTPLSLVQIWLYLCLSYKDTLTTPPKTHYYCVSKTSGMRTSRGSFRPLAPSTEHSKFLMVDAPTSSAYNAATINHECRPVTSGVLLALRGTCFKGIGTPMCARCAFSPIA